MATTRLLGLTVSARGTELDQRAWGLIISFSEQYILRHIER